MIKKLSIILSALGSFWQAKENGLVFRWNVAIIAVQLIAIVYFYNDLPRQIPIFFSLPWGEGQLGSTSSIFLLPSFSIICLLLNNLISVFYIKRTQLLAKLLIISSLIFSIFSLITTYHIINLTV